MTIHVQECHAQIMDPVRRFNKDTNAIASQIIQVSFASLVQELATCMEMSICWSVMCSFPLKVQ